MPDPTKPGMVRKPRQKTQQPAMAPELARFIREELGTRAAQVQSWTVTTALWIWKGKDRNGLPTATSWYFLTLGPDTAAEIRTATGGRGQGWGMVKVKAMIGSTGFETSLFPNKSEASFLLPVKASVRKAEKIDEGDQVTVHLTING
jgi:hypothetical protein